MKLKFFIIFILIVFVSVGFKKTFAQQNIPNPVNADRDLIRVGISTNDFGTLQYKEISVTSEGGLILTDKNTDSEIVKSTPGDVFKFNLTENGFTVSQNAVKIAENIIGPVEINAGTGYFLQIPGLKRGGKPAAYRGSFEIIKVPGKSDKFSVINILPLEEYLRGVVPNELPVSFGEEALKAQAIAARNYVLRPRGKTNPLYDVCDSVQSQVYFGKNTEKPLSDKAVSETKGLLSLYDGDIILALYSSTAGGYTESYENAFSEPGTENFPAKSLPYLKGKPDTDTIQCLSCEEDAKKFYMSSPASFDNDSRYFRWTKTLTEEELRKELNRNLDKFSYSSLITPKFFKGTDIGKIKKIEVLSRGVSGKIIEVCITAENGSWSVKKELLIRRIFTDGGTALPSANAVFENVYDADGNLVKIDIFGGGFGHGVGMSQYGAGYMSKNGYTFDKILQHYYDGTAIGTAPVYVTADMPPVNREFFSSSGKIDLLIDNGQAVDNFDFMINSKKISLNKKYLPQGRIRMPLDVYAVKGLNDIVYYPRKADGKSLKVWTEVFKAEK